MLKQRCLHKISFHLKPCLRLQAVTHGSWVFRHEWNREKCGGMYFIKTNCNWLKEGPVGGSEAQHKPCKVLVKLKEEGSG